MVHVYYIFTIIVTYILTRWWYYDTGYIKATIATLKNIGSQLTYGASYFNKDIHHPMVGNTLYEIGSQLIKWGNIDIHKTRNIVEDEKENRYHNNYSKYTKQDK